LTQTLADPVDEGEAKTLSTRRWLSQTLTDVTHWFSRDTSAPVIAITTTARDDWQTLLQPDEKRVDIRNDTHCPSCGVYYCPFCQFCEDDYGDCCWSSCCLRTVCCYCA
jgi:hypothetical protein